MGGGERPKKRIFLVNVFHSDKHKGYQKVQTPINENLTLVQISFDDSPTRTKKYWLGNERLWDRAMMEIEDLH